MTAMTTDEFAKGMARLGRAGYSATDMAARLRRSAERSAARYEIVTGKRDALPTRPPTTALAIERLRLADAAVAAAAETHAIRAGERLLRWWHRITR